MSIPVGFPDSKPNVREDNAGWLSNASMTLLKGSLGEQTRVVIELGSWLGKSARFIARQAPNATVFCVDHWEGSREHQHPKHRDKLPTLWDTFCVNCWDFREQIVPVKTNSIDGMHYIHSLGVKADVIYIDASHEYEDVKSDILLACKLWPDAKIIGDDWRWEGVAKAAKECSEILNRKLLVEGDKSWSYANRSPNPF